MRPRGVDGIYMECAREAAAAGDNVLLDSRLVFNQVAAARAAARAAAASSNPDSCDCDDPKHCGSEPDSGVATTDLGTRFTSKVVQRCGSEPRNGIAISGRHPSHPRGPDIGRGWPVPDGYCEIVDDRDSAEGNHTGKDWSATYLEKVTASDRDPAKTKLVSRDQSIPANNPNIWKYRWTRPVTYRIEQATADFQSEKVLESVVDAAALAWVRACGLHLYKMEGTDGEPDIPIYFRTSKEDPKLKWPTLGYGYYPEPQHVDGIHINDEIHWVGDALHITPIRAQAIQRGELPASQVKTTFDLMDVMMHEMGHCIGLPHSRGCPTCVMNWSYNRQDTLQPDDVRRAQLLYGPPHTSPYSAYSHAVVKRLREQQPAANDMVGLNLRADIANADAEAAEKLMARYKRHMESRSGGGGCSSGDTAVAAGRPDLMMQEGRMPSRIGANPSRDTFHPPPPPDEE